MFRKSILLAFAAISFSGAAAWAQCTTYPNPLSNGNPADAGQVMADFNYLAGCLAPLVFPNFTSVVGIGIGHTGTGDTNLSIGLNSTSNHYAYVDLSGDSTYTNYGLRLIRGNSGPDTNSQLAHRGIGQLQIMVEDAGSIGFFTSHTELMRLGKDGNFWVGPTPGSSSLRLYVNGPAGGTEDWHGPTSDARLKKELQPISGALALVKQLRGVRFQWRAVDEREIGKDLNLPVGEPQIGFVAQEVEAVVPEAVSRPKAGTDDVYSMQTSSLLPVLVEAIKEQQREIEQLRTSLAALKRPQ